MKKGTALGVAACVTGIVLLFALGLFLIVDLEKTDSESSSLQEPFTFSTEGEQMPQTDKTAQTKQPPQTEHVLLENETESEKEDLPATMDVIVRKAEDALPEHQIIFVGDSRTVAMGEAEEDVGDTCQYIGATGEGYDWFVEKGLEEMKQAISACKEAPVVFNLGVNDPDRVADYIILYQALQESFPETAFYYLSVNPVTEDAKHITNAEIADFNSALRSAFPDQYLDSYSYLRAIEFESVDGVHYSKQTSREIHDFVVRRIEALTKIQ